MTYNAVDDARLQKLLKRYIETHDSVGVLGAVPVIGQDREEQELIDTHRTTVLRAHTRATKHLFAHIPWIGRHRQVT